MCSSRFRSDIENLVSIAEDGPTARGDGVDIELRDLYGNAGCCSLKDMLISASEARYVGRLEAHQQPSRALSWR